MTNMMIGIALGGAAALLVQYLAPFVFGQHIGQIVIDPALRRKYAALREEAKATPEGHARLWSELAKDYPATIEGKWVCAASEENIILLKRRR